MSDEGNADIPRQRSRQRYLERAVLTAALCRELEDEDRQGNLPSDRSQTAYLLLSAWEGRQDSEAELELNDVAPDLRVELLLGSFVVRDLSMVYSAGLGMEYERDVEALRGSLAEYLARND